MRRLEEFWFRYFSLSTINDERYNWVRYVTYMIFLIPALIAVVLDIFERNYKVPLFIFAGLLLLFSVIWIVIWIYHKWRVKHSK